MTEKTKKLGDAELEIMQTLWSAAEPVTSGWVLERLKGRRDWALSALMTALSRLADKGFVLCDRSTRTNFYSPLVSEADYKAAESRSFLDRLYGSSVKNLVVSLYEGKSISDAELSELRGLIDELERKNHGK